MTRPTKHPRSFSTPKPLWRASSPYIANELTPLRASELTSYRTPPFTLQRDSLLRGRASSTELSPLGASQLTSYRTPPLWRIRFLSRAPFPAPLRRQTVPHFFACFDPSPLSDAGRFLALADSDPRPQASRFSARCSKTCASVSLSCWFTCCIVCTASCNCSTFRTNASVLFHVLHDHLSNHCKVGHILGAPGTGP